MGESILGALALRLPARLGPYAVSGVLGSGGMGIVYRAHHSKTGKAVALKTAHRPIPRFMLALRLEMAALRALSHPGIVRIVDQGNDGGPWYAMELLEGQTLADCNARLTREAVSEARLTVPAQLGTWSQMAPAAVQGVGSSSRAMPARDGGQHWLGKILQLYRALCEPLAHIHARGMVHRDLKPGNVFVRSDASPVLVDFGLIAYAHGALGREVLDPGERALGTLYYLAPEYLEGRQVDARADLYSLGCMLYESVCGRPPFEGNPKQICDQHLHSLPMPPSRLVPGLPVALDELILGLLAKTARARIGHANEVAAAIDALLGQADPAQAHGATALLYRPDLSGRQEDVKLLEQLLHDAKQGHGNFVLLAGESGVGKTFLASDIAFRASRKGLRVVTGECIPVALQDVAAGRSAGPLHPLRRLLQSIGDSCYDPAARERILGDRVELLIPYESNLDRYRRSGDLAPGAPALPASAARERTLAALRETLSAWLQDTPTLLVLDDLQWADDLTLALLGDLGPEFFATHPLALIGTCRMEDTPVALSRLEDHGICRRVALRRLEDQAVATMVADMLAQANPPQGLVQLLGQESEGNPFFVAEYLRYLVSERHLVQQGDGWRLSASASLAMPAPSSLRELLSKRLHALSEGTRAVVAVAAAIGRHFDLELIAAAAELELPVLTAALHEAQARQVLEAIEPTYYRFAHDRIRETCYVELSPEARRTLHARIAVVVEARGSSAMRGASVAAELAHHYARADNRRKALEYLEKAGSEALAKAAHREATAMLREALAYAARLDGVPRSQQLRLEALAADALQAGGEFSDSVPHLNRVLGHLGVNPNGSSALRMSGSLGAEVARQALHRGLFSLLRLPLYNDPAREQAARAFDHLQQAFYYLGEALPMVHSCVKMLNLTELSPPCPALTVAYANAHAVAGVIPWRALVGVYRRLALRNMELAPDAAADSYFLMLSGVYLTGIGAWDHALETLRRGFEIARQARYARRMRETAGALGVANYLRGNFHEARAHADMQDACGGQHDTQIRCWAALARAQVALAVDQPDSARRELSEASPLVKEQGRPERIWQQCLQAALAYGSGDMLQADEACSAALEEMRLAPPVIHHSIDAYRACAEVAVALALESKTLGRSRSELEQRARLGLSCLEKITRLFPVGRPRYQLVLGQTRWLVGADKPGALSAWQASLAAAEQLAMPYDAARAHLALARAQSGSLRAGHLAHAERLLTERDVPVAKAMLLGLGAGVSA